jgi:S-adenosylmethionine decarboxylase
MVRNVLNVFRPKRFVLTMFADEAAVDSMVELPTDPKKIAVPGFGVFARTSLASTKVETDLCCLMGCYALDPTADTKGALPVQAAGVKRHTHARSSSGSSAQWLCLD